MFGELTSSLSFLLIREWLNGGLFPLSFMSAMILGTFLINTRRIYGRDWQAVDGVSTATTLFVIYTCDAFRAGFAWFTLRVINDGGTLPDWLEVGVSLGFVTTASVLILMMIRSIYTFTPKRLGHAYWVTAVAITVAFVIASHVLPPFHF